MTSGLAVAMHIHRPLAQHRTAWGTGSGTTAANDATQRACCLWHCVPATTVWSAVYRSGADLRVQRQASRAFCSTGCVYNGEFCPWHRNRPCRCRHVLDSPHIAGTQLPTPRPIAAVFKALYAIGSHSTSSLEGLTQHRQNVTAAWGPSRQSSSRHSWPHAQMKRWSTPPLLMRGPRTSQAIRFGGTAQGAVAQGMQQLRSP